jgi:hypothetical protein
MDQNQKPLTNLKFRNNLIGQLDGDVGIPKWERRVNLPQLMMMNVSQANASVISLKGRKWITVWLYCWLTFKTSYVQTTKFSRRHKKSFMIQMTKKVFKMISWGATIVVELHGI